VQQGVSEIGIYVENIKLKSKFSFFHLLTTFFQLTRLSPLCLLVHKGFKFLHNNNNNETRRRPLVSFVSFGDRETIFFLLLHFVFVKKVSKSFFKSTSLAFSSPLSFHSPSPPPFYALAASVALLSAHTPSSQVYVV
jgi:hypothetical protein